VVTPSPAQLSGWLEQKLATARGLPVRRIHAVGGGCIHAAWRLELADGGSLFAKTNGRAALPILEAEAAGLRALNAAAAAAAMDAPAADLTIPAPLAVGMLGDHALLVLPCLELSGRAGSGEDWRRLGAALARLHRASRPLNRGRGFGFEVDNFIGAGPQPNGWLAGWGAFFRERRLGPQLERLRRRGMAMEGSAALLDQLPTWLDGHGADPVLVHGDLWSGNAGLLRAGGGAIFDPAVHWGDREVDLAMARLFGGFPRDFFSGYVREWPLPPAADGRVEVYNLYHLLNHANLFDAGPCGSYAQRAQASILNLLKRRRGVGASG
jgi:fructosamine-3-kinase